MADEETIQGELEDAEVRQATALLSPAALIMFLIAFSLDLVGFFLAIFGVSEVFSIIIDVVGLTTIGLWTYARSQSAKVTYGAAERLTKAAQTAGKLRWLRPLLIILEFVPFIGAAPCWIILVYFELKNS